MGRWPWISALVAAVAVLNPIGLGFLESAFLSSDQLSRNIARPIVWTAIAVWIVAFGLELWLRRRKPE